MCQIHADSVRKGTVSDSKGLEGFFFFAVP